MNLDDVKKYASLVLLLAIAIAIYFAVPGSLTASLLTQVLAIAVIGAGGKKLSRTAVSLLVFVVAGVVAYFRIDGLFPHFPAFSGGDLAVYAAAVFGWIQMFVVYATPIVGAAMLTYNLILEHILKLIGGQIGLRLEPK